MTKEQLIEFVSTFPDGSEIIGFITVMDEYYDCLEVSVVGYTFTNNLKPRLEFGSAWSNAVLTFKIK